MVATILIASMSKPTPFSESLACIAGRHNAKTHAQERMA
ncbi:hypothetical protein SEA_BOOPY_183 [Gordonia phage Boopy]|nr:hypothetical protein SEA_BOOPY_183 [Gordonia phage Boopy]